MSKDKKRADKNYTYLKSEDTHHKYSNFLRKNIEEDKESIGSSESLNSFDSNNKTTRRKNRSYRKHVTFSNGTPTTSYRFDSPINNEKNIFYSNLIYKSNDNHFVPSTLKNGGLFSSYLSKYKEKHK